MTVAVDRGDRPGLRAPRLLLELGALGVAVALAWWAGAAATEAWLARVRELGLPAPDEAVVRALADRADRMFTLGVGVLAAARALTAWRARDPLPAAAILPALVLACLLGLVVHHATVEVVAGQVLAPTADAFAGGFLIASVIAAGILLMPWDPAEAAVRLRGLLALAIAAIFVALAAFGTGPARSGTHINLGPVQPIEAVKLLAVLFLAGFLGRRAAKLRWQRRRLLGLRWPRLGLLVPALAILVAIVGALFVVGDLGPVVLLALVFLVMFYLVTRAGGWALAAVAVMAGLLAVMFTWPDLVDTGRVATRIRIWNDPWGNGLTHGHQVGEGMWAIAAGGWTGQGLAQAATPLPPAGKTDLVLAPMIEQLGVLALIAYLVLLGAIAVTGLRVAARSRTPERVLLAAGLSALLIVQWLVIQAGVLGRFPLTGIVAPFLSSGRSSMIAFVAATALIVRLAHDGRARASSDELDELHGGARQAARIVAGVLVAGAIAAIHTAVIDRRAISGRGILTELADGTMRLRQNPRLAAIGARIRRGTIADRHGEPLAITDRAGAARRYPLGAAMGTLLGTDPSPLLRSPWALERLLDRRLRPDLAAYAPLLELAPAERAGRVRALDEAVANHSVRLTIDARLQREVAAILIAGARRTVPRAAAAVVIDVDTGQVLARVQVPDLDPGQPARLAEVTADPRARRRFLGAYGEWPDRTGLQGVFQAGSIAKLFTAVAAARTGLEVTGAGCQARAQTHHRCLERDRTGPRFTRPGWSQPIHDHPLDAPHGDLELAGALAESCNVYFAQLGLELGAEPLRALRDAGVDVGYTGRDFAPGAPGSRRLASTAFGQGAMAMNVLQAARLVAAIGAGGVYRRCPPTMELDARCEERAIVADPAALAPIVAGLRLAVTDGTARKLDEPAGVRVYGKTGTADARGFAGEEPVGIGPGEDAPPHAWFVAFAEPIEAPACGDRVPGRVAVAVVVPRGGAGAVAAGPLAMQILAAARDLGYLGGS